MSTIGHVQTQINADAALMRLHDLLAARGAPKQGTFTSLDDAQKREYFRTARRRSRSRVKLAAAAGAPEPTTANIRDALADAALMILATDAPGAAQVRAVLARIFEKRPGVLLTIETKAKRGKIRPHLIARSPGEGPA